MNKEVKDLIQPYNPNIKNGVWYVTSGTRDVKKPYLLARLEELEAENKLLKQKLNQLETNRDEAIKLCNYLLKTDSVCINGKVYYKQKDDDVITRRIIEELERGKE